jgi:sodium/pantothenate symporter
VYMIAQFVAGARILESMLQTSYTMGLLLLALSVVAYTTYGGFRAVAWTDPLQGIVMIVGVALLVPLAVREVGGLEKATRALMARPDPVAEARGLETEKHAYLYGPGPLRRTRVSVSEERLDPWLPISMGISLFMLRSLASVMMPTSVPRMLAFKDTQALRRALVLLAPYFLLMYGSSLITMNCAYALDLGLGPGESDKAVPEVAKQVAPPLLAGLLIAAPFAAVMSTVDSGLLVISGSVVRDLIQRTWWPDLGEQMTKLLSYLVTGCTGVLVFILALLIKPAFLQPLVIHYAGSATAALFWPGIVTLYWKRATAPGVIAGLVGGAGTYLLCVLTRPLDSVFPLHPFVYGLAASGLLTYVVGKLTSRQESGQIERYFGEP